MKVPPASVPPRVGLSTPAVPSTGRRQAEAPQPQKVTFVARGIDPKMLERAKKMKKDGAPLGGDGRTSYGKDRLAQEIWKETGLWEYQPDVWVKEIPDNTVSVNAPLPGPEVLGNRRLNRIPGPGEPYTTGSTLAKGPMSQIIQRGLYDELYQLYPELKNIPVEVFNDYIYGGGSLLGGYVQRGTGNVYLGKARNTQSNYDGSSAAVDTDQQIRNALAGMAVHEVQHVVNMLDRLRIEKPNTAYNNRGTEVLATVAEKRRNLTAQQRREIPPMYDPDEFNFEGYKEAKSPNNQSPKRWDKEDVQSAPLLYGPYGIPEPKRSVKEPDPTLNRQYKEGGMVGPGGKRVAPNTESSNMRNESLDLPPVLQSLMSMPVAGGQGAMQGGQAAMQSGMQELRQLGILPTYQEGGMVGPGGMPVRPQAGLAPAGQDAPPMPAQVMEQQIQQFMKQNPQQVQQMQQAIMSGLQSGEVTMQELNMIAQLAKVASQNPQMYPQIRQFAIQQGIATEQDLPQQYDQGLVFAILLAAQAAQMQSQGGAMQPQQGAPPVPAPQGGMPMGGMPQAAMQAPVASMRMGGPLPTNSKNKDGSVPIIAHEGEYVIPSDVVRRKGTDFFDKMIGKDGSNGTGSSNS